MEASWIHAFFFFFSNLPHSPSWCWPPARDPALFPGSPNTTRIKNSDEMGKKLPQMEMEAFLGMARETSLALLAGGKQHRKAFLA